MFRLFKLFFLLIPLFLKSHVCRMMCIVVWISNVNLWSSVPSQLSFKLCKKIMSLYANASRYRLDNSVFNNRDSNPDGAECLHEVVVLIQDIVHHASD